VTGSVLKLPASNAAFTNPIALTQLLLTAYHANQDGRSWIVRTQLTPDMTIKTVFVTALAVWPLTSAFGQTPAAQRPTPIEGAYQQAGKIPARILDFSVAPASVQPGQSVTLSWSVENPASINIDPGIGPVKPRDVRQLSPPVTTTYTLTVSGPNGVLTKSVTVTVAGTKPIDSAAVQAGTAPRKTPRMPDGKPDLTGVYNSSSFIFAGRQVGGMRDPIVATLKPGAERYKVVRGPEDTGLTSNCMPTGVPEAYFLPYPFEIVQGVDRIVIMYEYPHLFRVVPIGGHHPPDLDPTWMGDSVGHWEGDTLVIDAIGFNDKTELPGGYRHSEGLHVVERFHRADADNLDWEATIEDPNVFAKPWTLKRSFPLRPELDKVDEFVCENNRDYRPFFKK
jgi:hypothetical protein